MKTVLHAASGAAAMLLIFSFLSTTLYAEFDGASMFIAQVKQMIVFPGLALLIPLLATTGALGARLAGRPRANDEGGASAIRRKSIRMRFVAANGLLVLVPCAFVLRAWSETGEFGSAFYAVQGLEIAAGVVNLTLLATNMRDGLRLRQARLLRASKTGPVGAAALR